MAAWLRGFAATPQSSTSGRGRDLQSTGEGSSLPAWSLPAAQQELSSRHSPGGPSQLPSTSEASSLPSWSRGLPSAEQEAQPSTSGRTSVQWPQAVWKAEVLLAGGTAGAVSKTATAPLSRLTILLQARSWLHASHTPGQVWHWMLAPVCASANLLLGHRLARPEPACAACRYRLCPQDSSTSSSAHHRCSARLPRSSARRACCPCGRATA